MVIHDTEDPSYHCEQVITSFKHAYVFGLRKTKTTIVTNNRPDLIAKVKHLCDVSKQVVETLILEWFCMKENIIEK